MGDGCDGDDDKEVGIECKLHSDVGFRKLAITRGPPRKLPSLGALCAGARGKYLTTNGMSNRREQMILHYDRAVEGWLEVSLLRLLWTQGLVGLRCGCLIVVVMTMWNVRGVEGGKKG